MTLIAAFLVVAGILAVASLAPPKYWVVTVRTFAALTTLALIVALFVGGWV